MQGDAAGRSAAQARSEHAAAPADELAGFLADFPSWQGTLHLDGLRRSDFQRLDSTGTVYLDYAGAGLYAETQVTRHLELLRNTSLGNPHSLNPTSQAATELVSRTRAAILSYFNASADDYLVAFTPNATGALRLVGESFPFGPDRPLLLTQDNHNSVSGIGEYARRAAAPVWWVPITAPALHLDDEEMERTIAAGKGRGGLFAFPAQSNFSGVKHPLHLVQRAQEAGWRVLLDAASFAPTNRLDLSACTPDFVCLSFYKMFGYPTGIGCLIARRASATELKRPWFAGGNVRLASVLGQSHVPAHGDAGFEDGTLDFLSIPAISYGLQLLQDAGIDTISERVRCLTAWTLCRMAEIRHATGTPLVRVLGPTGPGQRGGVIAFALSDPDGREHDSRHICMLAGSRGLSLRSGFFCNPGAGEAAYGLTAEDLVPLFREPDFGFDDLRAALYRHRGITIGALRASFGLASTFGDASALVNFLRHLVNWPVGGADASPA
jgi:molybdenum cofactor sulfurtransferase